MEKNLTDEVGEEGGGRTNFIELKSEERVHVYNINFYYSF